MLISKTAMYLQIYSSWFTDSPRKLFKQNKDASADVMTRQNNI